jgi:23S rRNA (cytosine1962-C5)-methyltransferase
LVIDRFGGLAVIQPNAAWIDRLEGELVDAIATVAPEITTIVKNGTGRARAAEGLDDHTVVLRGAVTGPIAVPMNDAIYLADVTGGQKTGLFFDQRDNHAFFQKLCDGARVLDVFSHVGGFSLAGLAAGATGATAVDGSAPALAMALDGAGQTGRRGDLETIKGDAFDVMAELAGAGQVFDAVVCDPPAFAPSKNALSQGLRAYERVARLAAPLIAPGGYLALCSCSHAASVDKFLAASARGIGRAGRTARLIHTGFAGPDHPVLPQLGGQGYLKALFFRLDP